MTNEKLPTPEETAEFNTYSKIAHPLGPTKYTSDGKAYRSVPTSPQHPFGVEDLPEQDQMKVEVIERLTSEDKAMLDEANTKKDSALMNAQLALSKNETAMANHENVILRLAMKYALIDGDTILEDGVIKRIERKV